MFSSSNEEEIGPEKARMYLNQSGGNIRPLNMSRVAQYAQDMKSGKWRIGNDAIVFDKNNKLQNGHHRLAAVEQAGVVVKFIVRRGAEPDEVIVMDTGQVRLAEININASLPADKHITPVHRQIAQKLLDMEVGGPRRFSTGTIMSTVEKYRPIMDEVYEWFKGQKVTGVSAIPVITVFVRAVVFGIDKQHLQTAANFLHSPENFSTPPACHQTLSALGKWLRENPMAGSAGSLMVYMTTEDMLRNWLDGVIRKNASPQSSKTKGEMFPLKEPLLTGVQFDARTILNPLINNALSLIANRLVHGQFYSLHTIGEMTVQFGGFKMPGRTEEQAIKNAATQLSKFAKAGGGTVPINGSGRLEPAPMSEDAKRIRQYVFMRN